MFGLLPPGVRGFEDERGNQWFYAAEVCKHFGYGRISSALAKHCLEDGIVHRCVTFDDCTYEGIFISEGNFYRLVLGSSTPLALGFKSLIVDAIMPAVRKKGKYISPIYKGAHHQAGGWRKGQ